MTTLTPLPPREVAALLQTGRAVLIDVREPDEFARGHVKGSLSAPLSQLPSTIEVGAGATAIFTCRSGGRTNAHCMRLAAAVEGEAFVLDGGLEAWAAAGLPLAR